MNNNLSDMLNEIIVDERDTNSEQSSFYLFNFFFQSSAYAIFMFWEK